MRTAHLTIFLCFIAAQLKTSDAFAFEALFGGAGAGCGMAQMQPRPCGCGGRKKRDITNVIGHIAGTHENGPQHAQCNNREIREIIARYLSLSTNEARVAIHKSLRETFPDDDFAVLCVDGAVAYASDSDRYCMDGNAAHNCYVFSLYSAPVQTD